METGLTSSQVEAAKIAGEVNTQAKSTTKSVSRIIADNTFTLFNVVLFALFILVIIAGSPQNSLFFGIVIINTAIGIFQEIRAKRAVDKMKLLIAKHARVVRDGVEKSIPVEELARGDVFFLSSGDEVSVDGQVLSSDGLSADESAITGESDDIKKIEGDKVLSGSVITAGSAKVLATAVGSQSYASQISAYAKRTGRARSEIFSALTSLIRMISAFLIPVGAALFISTWLRDSITWQAAAVSTTAAVIGMIPEGLMLLTTIAFAVGVIKLAKRRTLVSELPSMESLARVDTICLDKTGTLTTGNLSLTKIEVLGQIDEKQICDCAGALCFAFSEANSVAKAVRYACGNPEWKNTDTIPFNSKYKYSAACFSKKTVVMGAPEYLTKDKNVLEKADDFATQGYRVLLIGFADGISDGALSGEILPAALLLFSDEIRHEAADTLEYFKKQGVAVKIISGDNPVTIANVAGRLGLTGGAVDVTGMTDERLAEICNEYSVFGRVSPLQKRALIAGLRASGHTVAMLGDGTNDVPALREADCSVAMASGTDAAKGTSHIVLLDSDFSCMPRVVSEGRRVINNVERVASMFLVKTLFSMTLCLIFIILGEKYPYLPLQLTLVSSTCVGIPAFFLALEPNENLATPGFLRKVSRLAIPGGLTVTIAVVAVQLLGNVGFIDKQSLYFVSVMVLEFISMLVLIVVSRPLNFRRSILIILMAVLFIAAMAFFPEILSISPPTVEAFLMTVAICGLSIPLFIALRKLDLTRIMDLLAKKVAN